MIFCIPSYVKNVLNTLNIHGFDAWIVGGSIRDIIMGKEPFDFDIATSARPEQVINIFEKTIPTGIKHGTVTVISEGKTIEVTTYRTDNGYADSRHPESVSFVSNIKDDLSRRDFTVNAIAYNYEKGIYDPFNGIEDIKNKCLKTVGFAKERFDEDALRILRLFRFSSQLEFTIENDTLSGAISSSPHLTKISSERIREEFFKTICGKNPTVLNKIIKGDFLNFVGITKESTIPSLIQNIPPIIQIRFSYFCLINNLDVIKICKHLKTSKVFMDECYSICSLYKNTAPSTKIEIKTILSKTNIEYFKNYILLYECINNTNLISTLLNEIISDNEAYKIDMLNISGDDLCRYGYKGKEIGKKLNELLSVVIQYPELNNKVKLLELL